MYGDYRLTFWLSNSVVLRAILSESIGDMGLQLSAAPMEGNGGGKEEKHVSSPLKWIETSPGRKENKLISYGSFSDWDSPLAFTSALEKVEAWIFSRIIESVWWQVVHLTLFPLLLKKKIHKIHDDTLNVTNSIVI